MSKDVLTYEEYQSAKYFPALDGLRAISCLLIITWHADFLGWRALNGYTGVATFFVLSGYLITTLALREEATRGALSLKAFYVRRTFRIFPAYYCVLLLFAILIYGIDSGATIEGRPAFTMALPYYLFYLNEYTSQPVFNTYGMLPPFFYSWSLGVEEKFYLIWPILAFKLFHKNPVGRVAIALSLIACYYFFHESTLIALLRLRFYLPILVGCILAVLMEQKACYTFLSKLAQSWIHMVILVLLLAVQLLQSKGEHDILYYVFPYVVAFFIIGLVVGKSPVTAFFKTPVLTYLGLRTYGLYLLHILPQNAVELVMKPGPEVALWKSPMYFLACVILTVIGAEVLHRVVEMPCIEFGRRLSKRIKAKQNASDNPTSGA